MSKNWSSNSKMTFLETVLYHLVWSIFWTISLLPFKILYLISDCLYLLVYKVIGYRIKVVRKNIRDSFPDKSDAEIDDIVRGFYRHFCDILVETVKLASISRSAISKRMEYSGLELIQQAVDRGQGVTLYLGHYCNWEWVTTIGLHVPPQCFGGQVYHVLESKVMDKIMLRLRGRVGPVSIPMAEILRRMIKEKQEGKYPVIGFISDQSPVIHNTPCWIDFLHHDTPFISGTEKLSQKLHQTCVYLDISKVRRGYYHIDLKLLAEDAHNTADGELTNLYAKALEQTIQRGPSLWLWSHNRWKRSRKDYKK